jgi:hypothetical protein
MKDSLKSAVYPALRDAADKASAAAQNRFMLLNKVQLSLLCLVAFLSGLSFQDAHRQRLSNWSICVAMLIALATTYALRVGRFDDRWFRCRAYAENFKSLVWQYIMSGMTGDPDKVYLLALDHLRERLPDLEAEFTEYGSKGSLFTDWMKDVHALPLNEKVELYKALRLDDQITWYSAKSSENNSLETSWFWSIFCTEFAAIIFAGLQAGEGLRFNPVSGIAALGTVMIAWAQTKRFSDLATSYAIASGDLQRISEATLETTSQTDVAVLVDAVEQAVSREHSMWLVRRLPRRV